MSKALSNSRRYNTSRHQIGLMVDKLLIYLQEAVNHPSGEALDFVNRLMHQKEDNRWPLCSLRLMV